MFCENCVKYCRTNCLSMIEEYKLSIYDYHENEGEKLKTTIETFLEQTCGIELHVDNILIIHVSNKWFHSSKAKCQKAFETKRSFHTSNESTQETKRKSYIYIYIYIYEWRNEKNKIK